MGNKIGAAPPAQGVPMVLTGSATEMSDFNLNPFRAFTGGFPTAVVPRFLLRRYWYPRVPTNNNETAKFAPYGLRKIEAALIKEFGEQNVAVVHPYDLKSFVGPNTKAIGITSMEPAVTGFVSRTYTSLVGFGGEPVAAAEFRDLITNPVLRKWGAKIILGGAGSWQIHRAKLQKEYGIDCIVMGEGERTAVQIFRKALSGERLPNARAPNRQAISKLINSIAEVPGVEFIQPAHAALAPVVYDHEMVEEIGPVLLDKSYWVTNGVRHSSIEVGIETGSVRLMKKYMKGKMLPYKPEEWQDVVTQAVEIMNENYI